jgi:hypothetical protein
MKSWRPLYYRSCGSYSASDPNGDSIRDSLASYRLRLAFSRTHANTEVLVGFLKRTCSIMPGQPAIGRSTARS